MWCWEWKPGCCVPEPQPQLLLSVSPSVGQSPGCPRPFHGPPAPPPERSTKRLLPLYQVMRLLLNSVIFSPVGVCRMCALSILCRCTHMCVHIFGRQRPLPGVFLDQSSPYILRCVSHFEPRVCDGINPMNQFALGVPWLCLWLRNYRQAIT